MAVTITYLHPAKSSPKKKTGPRYRTSQLNKIFRLKDPVTVLSMSIVGRHIGYWGESSFWLEDIIDYLVGLNGGDTDVWPLDEIYMTCVETAEFLQGHGRPASVNSLAKMRQRNVGPKYVRVTETSIRYRQEDLIVWLGETDD